jgi:site-specific DNA-methyltransferase (adenine-specific)
LPRWRERLRFFYCAKASTAERNAGLDGTANQHRTVKPLGLMQWLTRLVTPAGGLVLDPFAGSGTTGVACVREGLGFVGIEREQEWAEIARARIAAEAGLAGSHAVMSCSTR